MDHIHFAFATASIGLEIVGRAKRIPVTTSIRGFDVFVFPLGRPHCYDLLFSCLSSVHSISHALARRLRELGCPDTIPVRVIHPAVSNFIAERRPTFSDFHDPIRIVSVGRLHWVKGYQYLIRALSLLEPDCDFEATIVGDGPDLERYVYLAHQLGLNESLRFVGMKTHEETLAIVAESDIYVQSSVSEGFCNAVLEAQALGRLCVASKVGGLVENILDGETGWFVPCRDPRALARTMIRVVREDLRLLRAIAVRARVRALDRFDIDSQSREFKDFFSNEP